MSRRVKKYLPVLKRITELGEKAKRDYVRKCDKEFLDCISECTKNALKGNVALTSRQKKLRRSRNDLRALSLKKTSLRKKRRTLQKSGFLSALLPPVLAVLSELFLK